MIEVKQEEKYLGDIQSRDGKNIKNVKARAAKEKVLIAENGRNTSWFYFENQLIVKQQFQ